MGHGQIIDGPYTSQSPYLDKSIKPTSYDPALAKKMIKASGWDEQEDQVVIPTGNQIREEAGDIMVQNLKDVGLNIQVSKYDFPTVLAMEQKGTKNKSLKVGGAQPFFYGTEANLQDWEFSGAQ